MVYYAFSKHHAPVGQFLKFLIIDIGTVKSHYLITIIVRRSEHERVVCSCGCKLHIARHAFIGMDYRVHLYATFMPPFFFPALGCLPTPLKITLENSEIVVESMMRRSFNQLSAPFLRLSEESLLLLVS